LLLLLDGTRNHEEVVEGLIQLVQKGELTIKDPDDQPIEDAEQIRTLIDDTTESGLHTAVRSSMIME
jgi:methyltransferase-like protein